MTIRLPVREKIMKKIIGIFLVLLLGGVLSAQEKNKNSNNRTSKFKLGILYLNSSTGQRFKEGIEEAILKYSAEDINIKADYFPYVNETDGLNKMESIIKKKEVDIILGPTESDVFLHALEQRKALEKAQIPVISSHVNANIPYQKGGWCFRTDINIERRVRTMHDFLNKYFIHSIAILYEDSELGVRAEKTFRRELQGLQKKRYFSLSYDPAERGRKQIRHILQLRPEAVGIFGERNNIAPLYISLNRLNSGWRRYLPLTFGITDPRFVEGNLQDNYFVSLTDITIHKDFDDVKALAYDTTILILQELNALAKSGTFNYDDPAWRQAFRNRFETILSGNRNVKQDKNNNKIQSKTGISFKNYENNTMVKVFKWINGVPIRIELEKPVSIPGKLVHKLALIWNSVGLPAVFNLLLLITFGLFLSFSDIKRWFPGKKQWKAEKWYLFMNLHFWFLFIVNIGITLTIYFYLGETGRIRYDNFWWAMITSLASAAVLRCSFFHTFKGTTIGVKRSYDSFVLRVHDQFTIGKYTGLEINRIAYYHSVESMRNHLEDIYLAILDREKRIRMRTRMEEILKKTETVLDARKALARLLLQNTECDEFCQIDFNRLPRYPEECIYGAVHHCGQDKKKEELINKKLQELSEKLTSNGCEYNLCEDLKKTKKASVSMIEKITLLFLLEEYDFLQEKGFLPGSWDVPDKAAAYCANTPKKKVLVDEKIEELLAEKTKKQKKEYRKILDKETKDLEDDQARLKTKIRFIFELRCGDITFLVKLNVLR